MMMLICPSAGEGEEVVKFSSEEERQDWEDEQKVSMPPAGWYSLYD